MIRTFIFLSLILLPLAANNSFAGGPDDFEVTTDSADSGLLTGFFDLRDRESFIQVTNVDPEVPNLIVHVQIFDVSNDCNENNFFDTYTLNDTHIYNLRNILTNDGNPSGVVLPDDSYGIITISAVVSVGGGYAFSDDIVGNLRILDVTGYEYRTNLQSMGPNINEIIPTITFNYNSNAGVILSDVVGIVLTLGNFDEGEIRTADIIDNNVVFDIDIYDLNETPFSCRDIVFACVDQDNPRLEELLEFTGVSVASHEYGINDAIPHSRGGELLCPGNNISDGIVRINVESIDGNFFRGYVGLNNGNDRGTIDSVWIESSFGLIDP